MTSSLGQAFAKARAAGRAAFIPFMTAGFPDPEAFLEILDLLAETGADLIEIGLPFSDPLADGPVIQAAGRKALEAGITPDRVLELTARAKAKVGPPLVLMTYFNPVLRRGLAGFASRAADSGAAGVIIPDLPPEEAGDWLAAADRAGLETIFMIAPTTTLRRREMILAASRGFVYYVALKGVTGADLSPSPKLLADIASLREQSPLPVAVGFGVAGPAQARPLARAADGVIVGSALIKAVEAGIKAGNNGRPGLEALAGLARSLKQALDRPGEGGREGGEGRLSPPAGEAR